jgi:hypothetical protein
VRALQSQVEDLVDWEPSCIWSNVLHAFRIEYSPLVLGFEVVTILLARMLRFNRKVCGKVVSYPNEVKCERLVEVAYIDHECLANQPVQSALLEVLRLKHVLLQELCLLI